MQRKTMIGLAAVAAVAGLLYMRSRNAAAESAGIGGVISSNAGALNAGMGNATWTSALAALLAGGSTVNNTKPAVADSTARAPAPAPAPAPVYQPWQAAPAAAPVQWDGDSWNQANGKPAAEGYSLGHLTPEQRNGRTDAQFFAQFA